jgi:hypothetical protein
MDQFNLSRMLAEFVGLNRPEAIEEYWSGHPLSEALLT